MLCYGGKNVPGSLSVLISTFFSVNVAFSFLQLYLIRVESLAKEEAALEMSVSTIGFTTWGHQHSRGFLEDVMSYLGLADGALVPVFLVRGVVLAAVQGSHQLGLLHLGHLLYSCQQTFAKFHSA